MEGLSIRDLSISFGGVRALQNVSLDIAPGEIVGLIGPNGAGKTSLVNCISRYYQPSTGAISFNGVNLLKKRPYQLLDLGVSRSFQDLNLPGELSVLDNVLLGQHFRIKSSIFRSIIDFSYMKSEERKYRRDARAIMQFFADVRENSEKSQKDLGYPDILGKGGYPDLLDVQEVPAAMLPYGIKKKVDLARAFVAHPKLLILDEPASGLGSADQKELINLVKGARSQFNTSILLIEHQMPMVMQLCDRIVVLNFGEKIAEGTPQSIRENPGVIEAYLGSRGVQTKGGRISTKSSPAAEVENRLEMQTPKSSEAESKPVAIDVRAVDLFYGHVKALSRVSLQFREKEITAVLGGNGAGKSSLMRAISGIECLTSGEILFRGERLNHYLQEPRTDKIVRLGVIHVAEGRRIFKELSIMENLRVAGYTLRDKKRVKKNIEKVFHYFPKLLGKLALKDAGNLSGGEQQMLAIGQALMMEPKVLLLDEPSLGLSPVLVNELFETIRQVSLQEEFAVVLVEQNTELALEYATYAYVLETGVVVKKGTTEELSKDSSLKLAYLGGS